MMVIDPNCPEWQEKGGKEFDSCYDCSSCYECAFNMEHYGSIDGLADPCEGCEQDCTCCNYYFEDGD